MTRFLAGNLYLALSVICTSASQVLIKALLLELGPAHPGPATLPALLQAGRALRAGAALALLVAGFGCWILCLARLELSYAFPIACSSVLLVALASATFLDEPMTPRMWLGTLLVLAGILLLTPAARGGPAGP